MEEYTLRPFRNLMASVKTTSSLSEEEKGIVEQGIRIACTWCWEGEPLPDTKEVRDAIKKEHPEVAEKLSYVGCCSW